MTKAFEQKVIREGIVDTRKYRYMAFIHPDKVVITRIEREYLGTTCYWETVKTIK